MVRSASITLVLTAVSGLGGAAASSGSAQLSGLPKGTVVQQVDPSVHPSRGTRRSRFWVLFTLRDAPGHRGVIATNYRIQVDRPIRSRAACRAPSPPLVERGAQGDTASVPLPKPRYGWCRGRYRVTVFLQQGPYCPPVKDGQAQPCPAFASQDLDVGQTGFTVRPPSA